MKHDHRMGWPAALLNIDAPAGYRREAFTPPRPRMSEMGQEECRELDKAKTALLDKKAPAALASARTSRVLGIRPD